LRTFLRWFQFRFDAPLGLVLLTANMNAKPLHPFLFADQHQNLSSDKLAEVIPAFNPLLPLPLRGAFPSSFKRKTALIVHGLLQAGKKPICYFSSDK
jgi:hypothetical protein